MRTRIYILLFLLVFSFLFFYSTLNYYFISDDFFHIGFTRLSDTFRFSEGYYHYSPIFWLMMWGLRTVFGINPWGFHLVTIILHIVNITTLFFLAWKLLKCSFASLIVAGLFAVFFVDYEVVYWITGISISLMTFFYLLTLYVFTNYIDNQKPHTYLLFLVLFAFSLLSHEYAISLVLLCPLYAYFFNRKATKNKTFKLSLIPFIQVGLLFMFKSLYSKAPLLVSLPSPARFLASIVKSFLYLFIPVPHLIDSLPKSVLTIGFLVLILVLIKSSLGDKSRHFLFLWVWMTVLIFSSTSLPQARYFYLSAIPTILLSVSIFKLNKLQGSVFRINKLNLNQKVGILWVIISFVSGIVFLQEQKLYWRRSSRITQLILAQIQDFYPKPDPHVQIYIVNLPDSVNGPPWQAYVFRRGLEQALELRYGFNPGKISYFRIQALDGKIRNDSYIDEKRLYLLDPSQIIVFAYDADTETIRILNWKS